MGVIPVIIRGRWSGSLATPGSAYTFKLILLGLFLLLFTAAWVIYVADRMHRKEIYTSILHTSIGSKLGCTVHPTGCGWHGGSSKWTVPFGWLNLHSDTWKSFSAVGHSTSMYYYTTNKNNELWIIFILVLVLLNL